MARFVLIPCKVYNDKFVRSGLSAVELDFMGLIEKFRPHRPEQQMLIRNLREVRAGSYVGMAKGRLSGAPVPFILRSPPGDSSLGWLLKNDPSVLSRVLEVYEVQVAQWDGVLSEIEEGKEGSA